MPTTNIRYKSAYVSPFGGSLLVRRIPSFFSRFIELNIKPNSTFELLYVQPNLQFGCEKSREFTIPTAEKKVTQNVQLSRVTSCRTATRRVANSLLLMLPNCKFGRTGGPSVASDHRSSGKFRRTKEVPQTTIWLSNGKLPLYLSLHILEVYAFGGLEIFG